MTAHEGHISCCSTYVLPNRDVGIVSVSDDKTVRRWNAATGEMIGLPMTGHTDWIECCTTYTQKDGIVYIISGGRDKSVRVWNAHTGVMKYGPLIRHTDRISCLTTYTQPDGRIIIVSGSWDKTLCRWYADTGELIGQSLILNDKVIGLIKVKNKLIACCENGTKIVIDISSIPSMQVLASMEVRRSGIEIDDFYKDKLRCENLWL